MESNFWSFTKEGQIGEENCVNSKAFWELVEVYLTVTSNVLTILELQFPNHCWNQSYPI